MTCESVIAACDKALEAKDHELNITNLALHQSEANAMDLKVQRDEKDAQLGSLWRNPYVLFGLGFLTAVVVRK